MFAYSAFDVFGAYVRMSLMQSGNAVAWWLIPLRSGVRAPLGSNLVQSLSKAHLLPQSTGNTQEAVAPSQHD